MNKGSWKQRIAHELLELAEVFLIIVLFFFMFATYRMMLLDAFNSKVFLYTTALVNAAVMSKVILIGEAVHVGKRAEDKPLIFSVLWKAFAFSVLAIAIELAEELVKGLIHGHVAFNEVTDLRKKEFAARMVIFFLAFIPFFAFREISRVLGKKRTADLFFRTRPASGFDQTSEQAPGHPKTV